MDLQKDFSALRGKACLARVYGDGGNDLGLKGWCGLQTEICVCVWFHPWQVLLRELKNLFYFKKRTIHHKPQ